MSTLDHALAWAAQGFQVAPLESIGPAGACTCRRGRDCSHPGKHPIGRLAPNGMLSASSDEAVIRAWWAAAPYANLGVRCADRLVVVDVDPRHGGDLSFRRLEAEHGPMPPSWRVLTGGGGFHVYFVQPAGLTIKESTGKLAPGVDVKANGYVVVPPSRHVSGRSYTWVPGCRPADVPLAPLPNWLVDRLVPKRRAGACSSSASHGLVVASRPAEEWRAIAAGPIAEGQRNATLASLSGYFLRHYIDPYVARDFLRHWNACVCRPPLDADELDRTFESIAARELQRRGDHAA